MNPVTSPENPTTPATPTTPASPYNTNQPAINALSNITNITRQLAHRAALLQHQQPIADQTIADTITTHQLHRKLQYLANVTKSRRDTLFSHKMI